MKEFVVKKCMKCGAVARVIKDCNCSCGFQCCGENMEKLVPNSADASVEKHLPNYEVKDEKIYVTVNHVMNDDHFIEWITFDFGNKEVTTYLEPGKEAIAHCKYAPGLKIYAYCNKHGLWMKEVE